VSRPAHRDTICVADGEVLAVQAFAGDQHMMRLSLPTIAARAEPGQFIHLRCGELLAMRRPLSIMRAHAEAGWIDLLYKTVGAGTRLLASAVPGDRLSALGPIGTAFVPAAGRTRPLLLGGGVGMPPMIFLAERMRAVHALRPMVVLGSEVPFPFDTPPSRLLEPGLPAGASGCMPLLEEQGIVSRLASLQAYPGCHAGYVTDLARHWLDALGERARSQVEVFACGPTAMLRAAAALASDYGLSCQVCLEEFMACAVGGCAGCAVRVSTAQGPAMRRVCVDGPVFDSAEVDWQALG
jgi:dihydroorotate dehydrogenase electron transfer subunit